MGLHWFSPKQSAEQQTLGLILPGGGARNAYQVGVLKAVEELLATKSPSPFPVVTGTSAGSLNAGMIASRSVNYTDALERLLGMWQNLQMDMVVKTDARHSFKTGSKWVWSFASGNSSAQPDSLLDNTPLRSLIENHVNLARMRQCIHSGHLKALGITASSYGRGASLTYFEGHEDIEPWERTRRFGIPSRLRVDHFMASIAIPVIFPAVKIRNEYHGDGSMRESAPLSPALHLGANKLLIISVRNPHTEYDPRNITPKYPNLGFVAGYMFDTLFMDRLDSDIERLKRINFALSQSKNVTFRHGDSVLRPVDFLVISPSVDIRQIVAKHLDRFPRSMRILLGGVGAMTKEGRPLTSYLLFDENFARDLIELGYNDGYAQRAKLEELLEL